MKKSTLATVLLALLLNLPANSQTWTEMNASKQESFDVNVSGYTDGIHTLVVKVTDLLNNVATARVELR